MTALSVRSCRTINRVSRTNLPIWCARTRNIISLPENVIKVSSTVKDAPPAGEEMFIFGLNSVRAALIARKRVFTRLYLFGDDSLKLHIIRLATQHGVQHVEVENKGVLNNLSGNRPHNGFVLECGPLVEPLISCLSTKDNHWQPDFDYAHSRLSGLMRLTERARSGHEYPLYILLDEVSDPQNIGSILRTAYFSGVDGIVLSSKNCAPISPVAVKASSGASEFLPIYRTPSTLSFIRKSQQNGWTCVATVGAQDLSGKKKITSMRDMQSLRRQGPLVLVFGSEGQGLRTLVKQECHRATTIPAAPGTHPLVDSLNIGVSVGIMLASVCPASA